MKACFFDFGGTLMDNKSDRLAHLEVIKKIKQIYKVEIPPEEILSRLETYIRSFAEKRAQRWIKSKSLFLDSFKNILGLEIDPDWFMEIYYDAHKRCCKLFPYAKQILRDVKEMGWYLGIISDIDDEYLYFQLGEFSITEDIFDSITTSDGVGVGKPNPLIFKTALDKCGSDLKVAFYIGDSLDKDIKGAKRVGMRTIWFKGNKHEDADYVISQLNEIPLILSNEG